MNTDIVYTLKKFFAEQQDEAAIPGLGVFYNSTSDENGKPLPEGQTVILFIEKTPRSNAFVNFLGYEENLTENAAIEILENWVAKILNDLKTRKLAIIPELGSFQIKGEKVFFTPALEKEVKCSSPDNYVLEDLPKNKTVEKSDDKKPITPENTPPSKKQPKNTLVIWAIIGAAIIVLVGGGIACYKTMPAVRFYVDTRVAGLKENFGNGFGFAKKQTPTPIVLTPPAVAEIDEDFDDEDFIETKTPSRTEIASTTEVIKSATEPTTSAAQTSTSQLPFKVIGGAFSVKTNADNFSAQMKRDGYQTEIIFDRQKQLHLVSLGAFDSMAKAIEFKENIRTARGIGCWVYRQ
ncbi:MAG: SPOR domain-containing protein [Bacteroidales bacterium]|jgi:nucleoid DNA-binding protein|nr:SPOR domain-containing protein [Bacteroidales bacterium]